MNTEDKTPEKDSPQVLEEERISDSSIAVIINESQESITNDIIGSPYSIVSLSDNYETDNIQKIKVIRPRSLSFYIMERLTCCQCDVIN